MSRPVTVTVLAGTPDKPVDGGATVTPTVPWAIDVPPPGALTPVRMHERKLKQEYDVAYRAWKVSHAAWDAQRRKIENDKNLDREGREVELTALGSAPMEPVFVRVEARDRSGVPLTGLEFSAVFERPTDKRADRRIALSELQTGVYGGKAADVAPGQWDLVLEADRAGERMFISKTRVFLK